MVLVTPITIILLIKSFAKADFNMELDPCLCWEGKWK
jgi:hypothetical protein